MNEDKYFEIYSELSKLIGEQEMMKIYMQYKGTSIQFPKGLYSKTYIKKYIQENCNRMNVRELSFKLDLTERRFRQIMKEVKLSKEEGKFNGKTKKDT